MPENSPSEVLLRKQLLLLATLVVGVTYSAGINPPGGVWQENGSNHKAGDSFLLYTNRPRYLVFYYSNSTALAASVVVIFLLFFKKPKRGPHLVLLRCVMVLDLIGFVVAYLSGSNQKVILIVYVIGANLSMAFSIIFLMLLVGPSKRVPSEEEPHQGTDENEELDDRAPLKQEERRKLLMLVASFTTVLAYATGLSDGYSGRVESDYALVGLDNKANRRFRVFFLCNTTAFMLSLFVVLLSLSKYMFLHTTIVRSSYFFVFAAQLGLLGAYTVKTYLETDTVYVLCLFAAVLAYITYVILINGTGRWCRQSSSDATTSTAQGDGQQEETINSVVVHPGSSAEESRKVKSLILLLATLTATMTYQAGLNPPGGVWWDGHIAGQPILLSTHSGCYKVFFYLNSGAFVLSLGAIFILLVQEEKFQMRLLVSMILGMVALMGAYTAGSWRYERSSIYVVVMAAGVIVYFMIHMLCVMLRTTEIYYTRLLKKRHKRLALVAILVATMTYQAVLSPPGGFQWSQQDGQAAGAVLLMNNYPRRFMAFFYCNTVSFMATMVLILFFISPSLYRRAVRCYAPLYGCIVLALLGLMAANASGIVIRVQTYAYVFVLLVIVVSVIVVRTIQFWSFLLKKYEEEEEVGEVSSAIPCPARMPRSRPSRSRARPIYIIRSVEEIMYRQVYTSHKYLILVMVLVAGTTYQAGLNPPGGLWQQDDGDHGQAGSPVLHDKNRRRYLAFFYCNSTSFVASVFVVGMQLKQTMWKHEPNISKLLVIATRSALVLDLLCILAAYAAGTTWELGNAIALVVMVLFCLAIQVAPWYCHVARSDRGTMSLRSPAT